MWPHLCLSFVDDGCAQHVVLHVAPLQLVQTYLPISGVGKDVRVGGRGGEALQAAVLQVGHPSQSRYITHMD